ncbi:MAG: hypothetical protein ACK4UJ_11990 [Leptonema sp. (in: bacteria)]
MIPERTYINHRVEAYVFGKSLLNFIKTKENLRIQEKEFLSDYFQIPKERIFFLIRYMVLIV